MAVDGVAMILAMKGRRMWKNVIRATARGVAVLVTAGLIAAAAVDCRAGEIVGRVVDAESGEALPARVYLRAADGRWLTVEAAGEGDGRAVAFDVQRGRSREVHTIVTAEAFAADVPAGDYTLRAVRGKEYLAAEQRVMVSQEGRTEVTLELTRWVDMAAEGWYSGDTHVHRSLDDLPAVLLAEDVNVALPLTYWVRRSGAAPEREGAEGGERPEPRLREVDATHVIWPVNTEYEIFRVDGRQHTLGAVFILNHREPFDVGVPPVKPLLGRTDAEGGLLELDKHNWPWSMMLVPVLEVDLYELSNNHIWPTPFHFSDWYAEYAPPFMEVERDAEGGFTERGWITFTFENYYALLNCGFRLRPTAGTASGVHPVPLGYGRVYVQVDGAFSYEKWIEGLDAGRSFVTTGPMLDVRFNDESAGHTFEHEGEGAFALNVTGTARSLRPLTRLELVVNGEVVRRIEPTNEADGRGGYRSVIDLTVERADSHWAAVRCYTEHDGRERFAHTAPVHVDVPGKPIRPRRQVVEYFIKRVQDEIDRHEGVLGEAAMDEYREALAIYRKILERSR